MGQMARTFAGAGSRARNRLLPFCLLLFSGCAGTLEIPEPTPARSVFPGFDTWRYPGDAVLEAWRSSSPYEWIGYYLPAPCHRATSWVGKREVLERMGWGVAILYVGQQVFEGQPVSDPEGESPVLCSRSLLTAEQGRKDAQDAIAKTEQEGFPRGSVIYLDVERVEQVPDELITYYQAWLREVLVDGRYVPGTYAHRRNAADLYTAAQAVFQEMPHIEPGPFWIAGGPGFSLDQPPWQVGFPFASIWQGALDVERSWGGRSLQVDENVATSPSPSAPRSERR